MKGKIFNAQEVQSMLAWNKTQFREVIKPQPHNGFEAKLRKNKQGNLVCMEWAKNEDRKLRFTGLGIDIAKPRFQAGQKIFCKESFWQFGGYDGGSDCDEPKFIGKNKITFCPEEAAKPQTLCKGWKKRPAQHMKQEHSRLTLQITEIKVEMLADISEEDAVKEGFEAEEWVEETSEGIREGNGVTAVEFFQCSWDETHKKPEEKWEANPCVFVYQFKLINN